MIKVNPNYLHLFIKNKTTLLYPMNKGMYLVFNKDTLLYEGIEMFYLPYDKHFPDRESDKLINSLIAKDILELV